MTSETAMLQEQQNNRSNFQNESAFADAYKPLVNEFASGNLLIIDCHEFTRDCLATSLRAIRNNRQVEVFSDVSELLLTPSVQFVPSLILFCYRKSRINTASLVDELSILKKVAPAALVMLISDIDDMSVIARALQSGVRGYIPANLPLHLAVQAIEIVEAGGTYLTADSFIALRHEVPMTGAIDAIAKSLTARQKSVLFTLRQGRANKVIAIELKMRESTVKVHVRNLMKKLNVKNRTELCYKTNGLFVNSDLNLPLSEEL